MVELDEEVKILIEVQNKVYEWKAEEQLHFLNKKLKYYFDSKEYKKEVKESQKKLSFSIDWNCYGTKIKERKD